VQVLNPMFRIPPEADHYEVEPRRAFKEDALVLGFMPHMHCVAHFDNSATSPNNPDATKAVSWSDQTWEEMMIGWMEYATEWRER
jgi:hypothetical protein